MKIELIKERPSKAVAISELESGQAFALFENPTHCIYMKCGDEKVEVVNTETGLLMTMGGKDHVFPKNYRAVEYKEEGINRNTIHSIGKTSSVDDGSDEIGTPGKETVIEGET